MLTHVEFKPLYGSWKTSQNALAYFSIKKKSIDYLKLTIPFHLS